MNEHEETAKRLEQGARSRGLIVWPDYPHEAPSVAWRARDDVDAFLDFACQLHAPVLYLETLETTEEGIVGVIAGFAVAGILHGFSTCEESGPYDGPQDECPASDGRPVTDTAWLSWEEREYRHLAEHVRDAVDAVLADVRYDGWRGESLTVLNDHAGHLDLEEFTKVSEVARDRFQSVIGHRLDAEAQRAAPKVLKLEGFDPLMRPEGLEAFIANQLQLDDRRVAVRVASEVQHLTWETGLQSKAEAELLRAAAELIDAIPPLVRDRIGFVHRSQQRDALLAPYLEGYSENRRHRMLYEISRLESEKYALDREARYATAARGLMRLGNPKSGAARKLGISTAVMDRICGGHQCDVELKDDDPIVATLAPELRLLTIVASRDTLSYHSTSYRSTASKATVMLTQVACSDPVAWRSEVRRGVRLRQGRCRWPDRMSPAHSR